MEFNIPFPQPSGNQIVDDNLFRLVEQLNATDIGAYSVFNEAARAIDAENVPEEKQDKSATAGYAALKALIIKTGDYALQHSETFSKSFSGQYVTVSEFGTYVENMETRIDIDETGITNLFSYTAGINQDYALTSQQFVKTGLLYYDDGVPKYGVSVGEISTVMQEGEEVIDLTQGQMINVTPGRISFRDRDTEVGYITGKKMHFPQGTLECYMADISGTLSADRINGGTINANNVTITNLNASNITSGNLSATRISGGTLDFNKITVSHLSADDITSGTLSASRISGGTLSASVIEAGSITAGKLNVACLTSSGNLVSDCVNTTQLVNHSVVYAICSTTTVQPGIDGGNDASNIFAGYQTANLCSAKTVSAVNTLSVSNKYASWQSKTIDGTTIYYLGSTTAPT